MRTGQIHYRGQTAVENSLLFFGGTYEVRQDLAAAATTTKAYYAIGGQMIAVRTVSAADSTLDYILSDHLGSTSAILDASGTLINQQRYLPFGAVRTDIPTPFAAPTDFGFTGQRLLDPGLGGLMDYKARFYSPHLSRFIQPDTLIPGAGDPQAWNRYSYVLNSPVRYSDPSGHMVWEGGGGSTMGKAYWKYHDLVKSLLNVKLTTFDQVLNIRRQKEIEGLLNETATETGFCLSGTCAEIHSASPPLKPSDTKAALYPYDVFDGIEVEWNMVDKFEAVLDIAGIVGDIALVIWPSGGGYLDAAITVVEVISILKAGSDATNGDLSSLNTEVLAYTWENNPILIHRMGRWIPLGGSFLSGLSLYDNFFRSEAVTFRYRTEYREYP